MAPHSPNSESWMQRCLFWHDALDPALLLASQAEIAKRRDFLEKREKDDAEDEKVAHAQRLVQVSVHPDIGRTLPLLCRPPAFLVFGSSLVVPTLLPHSGPLSAFISQLIFQSYSVAFTVMNRNLSVTTTPSLSQHPLYLSVSALYVACVGATPLFVVKRLKLSGPATQTFIRRILPSPLFALLGGLNVVVARISELDSGIQVSDDAGNVVGVSHNAGKKAVKETALSRAFLCGVTALTPSLVRQSPSFLRSPGTLAVLKVLIGALTFAVAMPISFSLFPLRGKIKREELEEEVREKSCHAELYFHRGV